MEVIAGPEPSRPTRSTSLIRATPSKHTRLKAAWLLHGAPESEAPFILYPPVVLLVQRERPPLPVGSAFAISVQGDAMSKSRKRKLYRPVLELLETRLAPSASPFAHVTYGN